MKRSLRTLLLLAVVFTGPRPKAQTPVEPAMAAVLQTKLDSCVNVFNVPGISATLLLPGDRFWNGASGRAHIYTNQQMDTALVFQQASVTKLFTATLVLQLVEEGLLSLDDTLGALLPPMLYVPGNVKVRHLLKHRSGIADIVANPNAPNSWLLSPNTVWQPVNVLETFGNDPLFTPGAAFSYSNSNYVLLGMIIEAVTGSSVAEEMRERFFDPLGMSTTALLPFEPLEAPLVPGWSSLSVPNTYTDDMTFFLSTSFSSMVFTAGALVSRPWDVARFNRELFSGELLSPAMQDTMRTCTNVNLGGGANGYGFGTMRYTFEGRTWFGHAGDINGFTQLSIHNQPDSVTLVLSINRNDAPRGPIAAALLRVLYEQLGVGVQETAVADEGLLLYPVPATDHVTLRTSISGNAHLEVFDQSGALVRSDRIVHGQEFQLYVGDMAAGTYVVRCTDQGRVRLRKLVVVDK